MVYGEQMVVDSLVGWKGSSRSRLDLQGCNLVIFSVAMFASEGAVCRVERSGWECSWRRGSPCHAMWWEGGGGRREDKETG